MLQIISSSVSSGDDMASGGDMARSDPLPPPPPPELICASEVAGHAAGEPGAGSRQISTVRLNGTADLRQELSLNFVMS